MRLLAFDTCLDKTYVTFTDGIKFENKVIKYFVDEYILEFLENK